MLLVVNPHPVNPILVERLLLDSKGACIPHVQKLCRMHLHGETVFIFASAVCDLCCF